MSPGISDVPPISLAINRPYGLRKQVPEDHLPSSCHLAPIDSTAAWAMRSSVAQSPPATPMPPMHSPSTMIGEPPSMAVQRSGPAANARPSACARSSGCACAPRDEVERLLDAAHTALVVAE